MVPALHGGEPADFVEGHEEAALAALAAGRSVSVAYSGHPATFRRGAHDLMAAARALGSTAVMKPAVWLEDCLCAELELDPLHGWQAFEAANFLLHRRLWSPECSLVLWSLDHIWERDAVHVPMRPRCLAILAEHLAAVYGWEHEVVLYEAFRMVTLRELATSSPTTLYVPPLGGSWQLPARGGAFSVIGAGMDSTHVTPELHAVAASSDEVFCLEPLDWLPAARVLAGTELVDALGAGRTALLVVPGHAAMGGYGREFVRAARELGFPARMLPSVSPLGSLYAQLGFNPTDGCQVAAHADPTAPAFLVSPEGWVKPVFPKQAAGADPAMLERLTAAAARENTEALLATLSEKERSTFEAVVFDRLRALADAQGAPSIKRLKPELVEVVSLRAIQEHSMDRIVEVCYGLGLDATSPGALLEYRAAHPDSELARLAWLNAFSRRAWEAL